MTKPSAGFEPSPNVAALRESATIAASARARALRASGHEILDLGAGELDFETPGAIRRAAAAAIEQGATRYTATEGILPLREAIARRANALFTRATPVTAGDVVVSTGSKQALFNACYVLFGEGDEVLIPAPAWTSYYEMVSLARARPIAVCGDAARSLKVTAALLADASTDRTRGVVLNSPTNPTGGVYDRDELAAILELATQRGWWVISDEIYRRIVYEGEAPSCLEVARSRERLIVVDGVAKAWAMTGWRIGWAIAPAAVAGRMAALQSHTTSNPATPSQHAALAALTLTEEIAPELDAMLAHLRSRRERCLSMLRAAPEIRFIEPAGAFYVFVHAGDGDALAERLLTEHGVTVVPGSAFRAPQWIRLSFAAPMDVVTEGVRRLMESLAAGGRHRSAPSSDTMA